MKERTSHSLFCMVAHFYQSITTLRTSNLIFQGRMGRVRCPWVPPGVTSARWGAETCIDPVLPGWRRGAGRSLHRPSPLLRWSTSPASCLPFLSFTQISPVSPSFKTSCSVLLSPQCWPGPGGAAWHLLPSEKRKGTRSGGTFAAMGVWSNS